MPRTMRGRALSVAIVAIVTIALIAGCGSSASPGAGAALPVQRHPAPIAHLPAGAPAHIAVILMENEEYGGIIGSRSAPYIHALARRYALATGMYAITHPSLPNYLALTGGSAFGIDSDCTDCSVGATSIVDQLERAVRQHRPAHPSVHGRARRDAPEVSVDHLESVRRHA